MAAQEQALALDGAVPKEPGRSWPWPTATTARTPAGRFGGGCRKPTVSAQLQWLLEDLCGGLPEKTHRSVGKETRETAHMERWNNTLRQRVGHFVRETLSFSKKDWWHDRVTHWFIVEYNLSCS
jgi:hypothetical protein